tara:strand:+ start:271 stop:636 length:366 start_codon:yes stop_codon:yes gene_type:complete
LQHARSTFPQLDAFLMIGDPAEFPEPRNFAYCTTEKVRGKYKIVCSPKIITADGLRVSALLMHELAHAVLLAVGLPRHTERECDKMAEAVYAAPIYYDPDLYVQTLDPVGGIRPRPAHLPR